MTESAFVHIWPCNDLCVPLFSTNIHPFDGAWGKGPFRLQSTGDRGKCPFGLQSTGARGKETYETIMTGVDPFPGFDIIT